jgi:ribonuclease E
MTKRMLIDATHAEETRVVVLDGSRLEDFDVETSGKKQLKGNIYLAKVVRVEPSLQAAFVEYGGNRHGFLAFSEIHPDYYQIPVADRQRLIALQAEAARAEQAAEEAADAAAERQARGSPPIEMPVLVAAEHPEGQAGEEAALQETNSEPPVETGTPPAPLEFAQDAKAAPALESAEQDDPAPDVTETAAEPASETSFEQPAETAASDQIETVAAEAPPETVGGEPDASDDGRERRIPMQYLRNYKIQEVIRRRQILLVQVVKEERGTKGAALTTYISLAGRFCVLMPNSPRGGGISRKITSAADRRRLKEITAELEIPDGMGMIVRTAGANRPKPEIKRDCEYLLRLWDDRGAGVDP